MHVKSTFALFTVALLVPAGLAVANLINIPGFGSVNVNFNTVNVLDGTTSLAGSIVAPAAGASSNTPTGRVSITGTSSEVTVQFMLSDGSTVNEQCSLNGQKVDCTAVVAKSTTTTTQTIETTLPTIPGGSPLAAFTAALPSESTIAGGTIGSGGQATPSNIPPAVQATPFNTPAGGQATPSNTPSSVQATPSKDSGAAKVSITMGNALVAVGVLAGMLL